jgi:hypothetical protein
MSTTQDNPTASPAARLLAAYQDAHDVASAALANLTAMLARHEAGRSH